MSYDTQYFRGRPRFVFDFEGCSTEDLNVVGGYRWVSHPNTQLTAFSGCVDRDPVDLITWTKEHDVSAQLAPNLKDAPSSLVCVAHNAAFERQIVRRKLGWVIPDNQWSCTMIRAAYYGLPMDLDKLTQALHLPIGKDAEGHRLMLQMARPRKDGSWWHETDPEKLERLGRYCVQDTTAERWVDTCLPELPAEVYEYWQNDLRMNDRGMDVDLDRVEYLIRLSDEQTMALDTEIQTASGGSVASTRAVADICRFCGVSSVAKDLLPALIEQAKDPRIKRVLEIRQQAAKTSVSKLFAMRNWCDGLFNQAQGMFQFYGAWRTGRYAGRGPQPQNYPRPHVKTRAEIETYVDASEATNTGLNLQEISSALRSCFIARGEYEVLLVLDFEQIEARVLAWLAYQVDILKIFASGQDVYEYMAARVRSKDRSLGKVLVLACGYGMGLPRFLDTARAPPYNLTLTEEQGRDYLMGWREKNDKIVTFWYRMERAVKFVVEGKGAAQVNLIKLCLENVLGYPCLRIELPSGRSLFYREPYLNEGGEITFMGQNQYTKKWERLSTYGAKVVENVTQAVAADLIMWLMKHPRIAPYLTGTVHDEVIAKMLVDLATANLTYFRDVTNLAADQPEWTAAGEAPLPLAIDGFISKRYGK